MKSVQKQLSTGADANSLLGFTYQDDDYMNHYSMNKRAGGGRRRRGYSYRPLKDYSVLSAFKFSIREPADPQDHLLLLYDVNE